MTDTTAQRPEWKAMRDAMRKRASEEWARTATLDALLASDFIEEMASVAEKALNNLRAKPTGTNDNAPAVYVGDYRPNAAEAGHECVTTYRAEAGDCDGPADRQVTYRSSRNHDKVLDTHGPLCNAHAVYEQRRARAAGQIADSTIDPYARP